MNKLLFIIMVLLFTMCSSYNVKKEINNGSTVSDLKNSGVIFKIPLDSTLMAEELIANINFWIEGSGKNNNLKIITGADNSLIKSENDADRFFQTTSDDSFLKYKSLGVISSYIRKNESSLKKLFSENKLDSLIIYDIDGIYSAEMQFIVFSSVITILDAELKVIFLDHQKNIFDINEIDPTKLKKHMFDLFSDRFIERMYDLDFLKKL